MRLFLAVLATAVFLGCSNPETRARELFNQALALDRNGKREEAKELLDEVLRRYAGTVVATAANERLDQYKADEKLQESQEQNAVVMLMLIDVAQTRFASVNGRYADFEELVAAGKLSFTTASKTVSTAIAGYVYSQQFTATGVEVFADPVDANGRLARFVLTTDGKIHKFQGKDQEGEVVG